MADMEHPDRIHLRDYIVSTEIGAFQSERGTQQRLRFDLSVDLAQPVSGVGDQVDAILSYDVLTRAVETALADQRYNLVETLAEKIAAEVLAHPNAARIEVTVEKLDRGPFALGVTITRSTGRVEATASGASAVVLLHKTAIPAPAGPVVIVPSAPGLPLPSRGDQRRIALLALDQAAWALAGDLGLSVAESRTELEHAILAGHPVVWAPARLAADDSGAGVDPFGLALWLARRLDAREVLLALPADEAMPDLPADLPVPVRRTLG